MVLRKRRFLDLARGLREAFVEERESRRAAWEDWSRQQRLLVGTGKHFRWRELL